MAVWEIDRVWERDSAQATSGGGRRCVRGYDAWYFAGEDDPEYDPADATDIGAIEQLGEQHGVYRGTVFTEFTGMICTDITAKRDREEPHKFAIDVVYEEPRPSPGFVAPGVINPTPETQPDRPDSSPPEPWDRPPLPSLTATTEPWYQAEDLDGTPFRNPAGDPLTDPPPIGRPVATVMYTAWRAEFNTLLAAHYVGKVNGDEWNGYGQYQLLITNLSVTPKEERGRAFWQLVFSMKYKPEGWQEAGKVLARGSNCLDATTGEYGKVKDVYGRPTNGPALLAADGTQLPPAGTPHYQTFALFYLIDFADIFNG